MKKEILIGSAVVAIVAAGGTSAVGLYRLNHRSDVATLSTGGSIALSQDETKNSTPAASGEDSLSVKPASGSSLGATSLGNSNSAGSGNSGSGSSANSNSNTGMSSGSNSTSQLPGPDGFGIYEQYKSNETALYMDITPGTGPEVKLNTNVTVNYRGWLSNGKEFDESYARGKPFTFVEGGHTVILGWEQAMFGMKVGGKRRLIIPPGVGYGAEPKGDSIPANSLLIFDVELVAAE